jgi:pimeloyl-ACP methyl ester carboxylesterase
MDSMLTTYDHHRGSGPTLVLLHYWGGSSRTWQPVLDHLPARDTVTIDARGWGRSRGLPGPYNLRRMAQDTLDVITEAGVTDYVLVGHSMGGKVAQLAAATRPSGLVGLVLVASGPSRPPAVITPDYQQQLSHAYDSAESVAAVRDHILTATALPEALKTQVTADSLAATPEARAEWPLRGIAEDITTETRTIEVPTLVVAGEFDQVEPPAVLTENLLPYLARARLTVLPGTGHLIPLEAPAALAEVLKAELPGEPLPR